MPVSPVAHRLVIEWISQARSLPHAATSFCWFGLASRRRTCLGGDRPDVAAPQDGGGRAVSVSEPAVAGHVDHGGGPTAACDDHAHDQPRRLCVAVR